MLKIGLCVVICLLLGGAVAPAAELEAQAVPAGAWSSEAEGSQAVEIDAGFHLLYDLKAVEARAQFAVWQKAHPQDPLGSASEAASYLFEECYQQGVLTSEFFLDDSRFLGNDPLKPNPACVRRSSPRTNALKIWRGDASRQTRTMRRACSP